MSAMYTSEREEKPAVIRSDKNYYYIHSQMSFKPIELVTVVLYAYESSTSTIIRQLKKAVVVTNRAKVNCASYVNEGDDDRVYPRKKSEILCGDGYNTIFGRPCSDAVPYEKD